MLESMGKDNEAVALCRRAANRTDLVNRGRADLAAGFLAECLSK